MIPSGIRIRMTMAAAGALMLYLCSGCSATTSRNVASFIFDGVPAPPVPEEYCASWMAARQGQGQSSSNGKEGKAPASQGSSHPPYAEKRCNDCHDTSKEGGLATPRDKLCFLCHEDILKGLHTHAPAVAGNCLACHLPHDAVFPSLLKMDKAKLCDSCHVEKRLAPGLHARVAKAGILCTDCHDPHAGSAKYFLK